MTTYPLKDRKTCSEKDHFIGTIPYYPQKPISSSCKAHLIYHKTHIQNLSANIAI
jgi:hypothetical protein